ncbi:MAG TPA: DNA-binding protein [Micromonosporaceae bacterium]|nr:DNA-binding protein [Micromonosporaceae bacterium]
MTITAERTVLPPDDPADHKQLAQLAVLVAEDGEPVLVSSSGQSIKLPPAVYEVLMQTVAALHAGRAVTVAPSARRLTTQDAANLLGISRPTLIGLLDAGRIPFEQPGRHRRVRIEDVIAYRDRRRKQRREALQELIRETEDLGLYDDND